MALFWRGAGSPSTQRASNLPQLIDEATGARRGVGGRGTRHVGWSGAMSIPAVWSAVRLRANVISTLPVGLYKHRPETGLPQRIVGNAVPGVLSQPSAAFDIISWLHASQVSLDLRGNAYGRIVARDQRTYLPTQIELVHPDDVTVRTLTDGSIEYRFGGTVVPTFDVWHERQNEVPGSVCGESPIAAAARSLGINLAAADYGGGFYDEALTASGLLSSEAPIDEQQAKIAKARILAAQNGREPIVLGGNWSYRPITVNPAEAMFLEVMRYGDTDVARLFDVPGEMIEANTSGSSITYANREQRVQDLLAFRLGPAIARRERALSKLTVRGQYVKLTTAALLRADLTTRYKSYEVGLRNGFLALEEVRALEEREPLTPQQLEALHDAGLLGAATPDDVPATSTTPTPATNGAPTT